jgi:beta-galactosidase/beta-glucuronidase
LVVNVLDNDKKIVSKTIPIGKGKNNNEIEIKLPNAHLWSPNDPFLYSLSIELNDRQHVVDHVKSYFGMRKIAVQPDEKGMDRIFLNNKYTYNLGILDQGFWPDGLYTAPNDEALEYDIKAIKLMGFNTIRKHIKIEPARWYYYADKLGILVWQDFVNPVQSLPLGSKEAFEKQMKQTIAQLYNHPSIVTWVLFNEFWGAYNQTRLTDEVKKLDPSRIVNSHSGQMLYTNDQLRVIPVNPWKNSDIVDVHSYPFPRNTPNLPGKA